MSRNNAVESPAAAVARRQPLLMSSSHGKSSGGGSCRRSSRMGQTAGECTAVCCCCPCAMLHLLFIAVYHLPRGLWRRKKKEWLLRKKRRHSSSEEKPSHGKSNAIGYYGRGDEEESNEGRNDVVVDWDNEMWGRFDGAGFWRSASQRKDDDD